MHFQVSDEETKAHWGALACPRSHSTLSLAQSSRQCGFSFQRSQDRGGQVPKVLGRSPSFVILTRTSKEPRHLGRREAYVGPQERCGLVCWGAGLRVILCSRAPRGEGDHELAGGALCTPKSAQAGRTQPRFSGGNSEGRPGPHRRRAWLRPRAQSLQFSGQGCLAGMGYLGRPGKGWKWPSGGCGGPTKEACPPLSRKV